MKAYFINTILTLFSINIFAQNSDLQRSWIGDDLEFIKIDTQQVYFEVYGNYPHQKKYHLIGDTLRLYDKYTTSRDNFSKQHIKNYDFLINKLTSTNLTLVALDSNSLEIAGNKKIINYHERHLIKNRSIEFEEIKFSSTNCAFGKCPSLSLQINSEKELKFIGRRNAIKQGFYTALIPDSLYLELLEIISISELDKLKTWQQQVADAPEYTIEIHYNNKFKYLKNFFLPAVTNELIRFLLEISKKIELIESKDPFEINFTTQ